MATPSRASPLTTPSRASPALGGGTPSRSSSPAMQASSAGLAVTLNTNAPSYTGAYTGGSSGNVFATSYAYQPTSYALSYTQPTTYASTNPFLTGPYMQPYTPGDSSFAEMKFNGSCDKKPFYAEYTDSPTKYNTLGSAKGSSYNNYETSSSNPIYTSSIETSVPKYNTLGKSSSYLNTYDQHHYEPQQKGHKLNGNSTYDTSPNVTQSSMLLGVEETPTPTSSIETEDSVTREVGERDVEGDGEQSD